MILILDIDGLINLRKAYQSNLLIGYINKNSLREKIVRLGEVLQKLPQIYHVLTKQNSIQVSLTTCSKY